MGHSVVDEVQPTAQNSAAEDTVPVEKDVAEKPVDPDVRLFTEKTAGKRMGRKKAEFLLRQKRGEGEGKLKTREGWLAERTNFKRRQVTERYVLLC